MKQVVIRGILVLIVAGNVLFPKQARAAVSNWQKGASFFSHSPEDFNSENFKKSLSNFQKTGGNYTTLIITLSQDNQWSTTIRSSTHTPTDDALKSATAYAKSLGMKVAYKVHIDLNNGEWRAYINPDNRAAWFNSYSGWMNHYAQLASDNGAEELVIGAELYKMTSEKINASNTTNWNTVISNIRNRYKGTLTYSAQRDDGYHNEWGEIGFWGSLDVLGISGYYALATNKNTPSTTDYINSWSTIDQKDFLPMYQKYNKNIIFSEIGYRSENGTHFHPWDSETQGGVNLTEQANLYEGLFSYWNDKNYLTGINIWDWNTNPEAGGVNNSDYTPQNKPAEVTITSWFSNQTSPTPTPTATPQTGVFTINGTSNPSNPTINQEITTTINIASQNQITGVVDIEIFDSSNQREIQKFFENQTLGNTNKSFQVGWKGGGGTHRVAVGIFGVGWQPLYTWRSEVMTINIGNQITPTPTQIRPSPTPTTSTPTPTPTNTPASSPTPVTQNINIDIWWPTDGARVSGVQPFKALVLGGNLDTYRMYWQVDGGGLNEMNNSNNDYPHKESLVNLEGWRWKGSGPYGINFVVKDMTGKILKEKGANITIE